MFFPNMRLQTPLQRKNHFVHCCYSWAIFMAYGNRSKITRKIARDLNPDPTSRYDHKFSIFL